MSYEEAKRMRKQIMKLGKFEDSFVRKLSEVEELKVD
jgi:hypothetical protein